jgi:hypothetical protein
VENGQSLEQTRANMRSRGTVRHVFPGGVYKIPQTIFDLLDDEGIDIPEVLPLTCHI